ncbi:MAG: SpoIID/LytB domain-containing protein [Lachnospiraceae bacterium]|nr:SpoIID/LytB domain-containing protein [Lachnospiraceae bacterium]
MDRNGQRWNKSNRMQMKAFVCLLGFLLLVILLAGKFFLLLLHRGDGEEVPQPSPTPYIPVVETYRNVWIMEADEEGLLVFQDGASRRYPWGTGEDGGQAAYDPALREQVADIVLTDGRVTSAEAKTEKINGKVLSADEGSVEVEGYGRLPLAADCRGYRLYDTLEMCTVRDLHFGYSDADLCLEEGEVCGILMVREPVMEYIRVLLKNSDYQGIFHEKAAVTCDTDFSVIYGGHDDIRRESHTAGDALYFDSDSDYFVSDRIRIVPEVLTGKVSLESCSRSQGTPAYRGAIELLKTEDGIVVVNEVLLEEYLYSVVPSEMPSGYPPEALKTQAVCARTYAYGRMEHAAYPQYGAHLDDSTSYQVYNNILEQESTTTAVKNTYGQILLTGDGRLAETFYYSTSCGVGSDANVWKTQSAPTLTYLKAKPLNRTAMTAAVAAMNGSGVAPSDSLGEELREEEAFAAFIRTTNPDDFEREENWYRWSYQVEEIDAEHMLERLQRSYQANDRLVLTWEEGEYVSQPVESLSDITDIYIEKRGSGGVADELVIEAGGQKIKVISEHYIRSVLNDGASKVVLQNGSEVAGMNLLPSGFFTIMTSIKNGNVVGYNLYGGGFGHGVGMSQNGARDMAESGYSAMEILLYFYENCSVENIY